PSGEGYVGAELEVGVRAPDLVFGVAKESVLEARLRRGPALETELEVRLVERLEAEPASSDQLKSWAPWGWRNLRETALAPLVVRGVIACTAETWHLATDVAPAFSS